MSSKQRQEKPASTRRQLRRQATIDEILETARVIIREEGAAALNLNEVARRVGIKTPSLYEYFPEGKMQIYDALFALGFQRFAEYVKPAFEIDDPWASLHAALEAYLSFALAYPELFRICFERPVPGFTPSEESMQQSYLVLTQASERVSRALAGQLANSSFTLEEVRDVYLAMMHGLAAQHLANEPNLPSGQGRFGGLTPIVIRILQAALANAPRTVQKEAPYEHPDPQHDGPGQDCC